MIRYRISDQHNNKGWLGVIGEGSHEWTNNFIEGDTLFGVSNRIAATKFQFVVHGSADVIDVNLGLYATAISCSVHGHSWHKFLKKSWSYIGSNSGSNTGSSR